MNPLQMMQMINQFKQNPMQILSQKFNIPQGLNDPNEILKHLLDTNQVSQQQVNQVLQMKDNPMFKGLF